MKLTALQLTQLDEAQANNDAERGATLLLHRQPSTYQLLAAELLACGGATGWEEESCENCGCTADALEYEALQAQEQAQGYAQGEEDLMF
jgi:hypothetical protein